jgi:amidase
MNRRLPFLLMTSCLVTIFTFFSALSEAEEDTQSEYSKTELCYMPATELIKLFKSQEISPVDVLQAQIERIEALNPQLIAIAETHYEEALIQAKESEARYQQGNPRPLEGITCGIKDDLEVKGWRSSMGSLILMDAPLSVKDSALITTLRDAGVVMHVQTNVPEFYCNLVTWNYLHGICR